MEKMKPNDDFFSFGRYLRAKRLEKGVSLEEVALETKISRDTLLLIEDENHERLPAEVYVLGFLRAYAKAIGADGDLTVRNYIENRKKYQKVTKFEYALEKSHARFWPRFLLSLGALICMMIISIFLTNIFMVQPRVEDLSVQQNVEAAPQETTLFVKALEDMVASEEKSVETVSAQSVEKQHAANENGQQSINKFLLQINAMEETWMKIIVDNQSPSEYTLKRGELLALEASTSYSLLIGNAGGISLMLNDSPVEIPGRKGQVVTIQIP